MRDDSKKHVIVLFRTQSVGEAWLRDVVWGLGQARGSKAYRDDTGSTGLAVLVEVISGIMDMTVAIMTPEQYCEMEGAGTDEVRLSPSCPLLPLADAERIFEDI